MNPSMIFLTALVLGVFSHLKGSRDSSWGVSSSICSFRGLWDSTVTVINHEFWSACVIGCYDLVSSQVPLLVSSVLSPDSSTVMGHQKELWVSLHDHSAFSSSWRLLDHRRRQKSQVFPNNGFLTVQEVKIPRVFHEEILLVSVECNQFRCFLEATLLRQLNWITNGVISIMFPWIPSDCFVMRDNNSH